MCVCVCVCVCVCACACVCVRVHVLLTATATGAVPSRPGVGRRAETDWLRASSTAILRGMASAAGAAKDIACSSSGMVAAAWKSRSLLPPSTEHMDQFTIPISTPVTNEEDK